MLRPLGSHDCGERSRLENMANPKGRGRVKEAAFAMWENKNPPRPIFH